MTVKSILAAALCAVGLTAFAAEPISLGEVTSHEPWDGKFDVEYALAGLEAGVEYKVAFDLTAAGQTVNVTNAAAELANGTYTNTLNTVDLFGAVTTDKEAEISARLIKVESAEIGKDGPKTFWLGPKGEPGSETNPWEVGEGVEAWTNGTELVIQGAGSVTGLTEIPGEVKGGIDAINVASNGVTGVAFDAFQGIDNIALTLPDGWQGELPDEDGNWYGATGVTLTAMLLTVKNVTFQQRYPWNGKVDVGFGLTGPEGETDVIITVRDGETEIANFTAAVTIPEDGVLTTNLVWDAANPTADFKSDDVTVEVAFKVEAAQPGQLWKDGPIFAECNVGATKPEEYGYYFWWGDTVGYKRNASNNGWVSVKDGTTPIQFNDSAPANTLYNKNAAALAEYVDANGNLKSDYDAATAHLGAPWRMMTKAELDCLVANCEVEWTDNWNETGIKGTIVKGKGDYSANSIFLPAAGWGYESSLNDAGLLGFYWSSTPNSDDSIRAWGPSFNSDEFCWSDYYRYYGQSVRAVRDAAVTPVISAKSAAGALDLTVGDRVAKDVETLIADPAWDESTTVTVFIDGEAGAREYTTASKDPWQTTSLEPGRYAMTLAGDECAYSAGFWKLGEDWVVLDGSELTENMVFEAGKTYLVLGTNMVNGKTLMVEDGAKFFYDEGAPAGFKSASVAELPKRYEIADGGDPADESKLFQIVEKPRGSEDNPWDVGDGATAYTNGTGTVFFKPERGVVTKAGLTKIAAAMGDASFLAKLVSPDGSETNDVVMVLGGSGTVYDTIAEALAADETSYTLFEVMGYFVSYNANGAAGEMATDTFIPSVPTNLTANAFTAVGYEFLGWTTNGCDDVACADRAAGTDFAEPGETLVLKAKWNATGVEIATFDALTNALAAATNQTDALPVTVTLTGDITVPEGGAVKVNAGPVITFEGEGTFDVTSTIPTMWHAATVGEGLKQEDLDRFVTDEDAKAYFENGKVVLRARGESEDFPWILGEGVTAWVIDGAVLANPARGTASVAALETVTNALGVVPGPGELKVLTEGGTVTNDVVMFLGDNGVPYDTLADVFAADPLPETVRLFEVKGANVEFNAMGGVHVSGLEVITNFCIVTYTLPEVERDGYTLVGWFNGWKAEATKVEDGQDLLSYEPHPLYAQWQANNPTPTEGELEISDVTNDVPVTSIEAKQYVNDTSLKSVTTPLYLQSIGQRAFMGCTSLEKLTISAARSYDDLSPVKVAVGQNAFSGCSSLDTVYIAAEIDNLGQSAFQNCAKLKKIVFLGDDTITYGASAFYRCGYQNGTGSLKVYMSSAFQLANKDGLIADLKRWNTQLKIIEKVDVTPVEGGSINIGNLNTENLAANNRRLAILVKTSVQGTPDPDDVDIEYSADLSNWSTLTEGTEKTANPDGTVLIEATVPEGSSGFFRAVIR